MFKRRFLNSFIARVRRDRVLVSVPKCHKTHPAKKKVVYRHLFLSSGRAEMRSSNWRSSDIGISGVTLT